jgi:nondiscriminating aspartyl-tRNA synthetase
MADLNLLEVHMPEIGESIPWLFFPDAQQLIYEREGIDARGEPDLAPEHERALGRWAREERGSDFVFVTGYPMVKRHFYTHPDPDDPTFSNGFDLLFRGMELVTGGQRLHRYDDYVAAAEQAGYDLEPFSAYLECFRFGMPPHGGFAIGLERFVAQLLGVDNVRWVTLFPRDLTRLEP